MSVVCHMTGSGLFVPHTTWYHISGIVEKITYELFTVGHNVLRSAVIWATFSDMMRWSCLPGAQSSAMVVKNQLTVVYFVSGPPTTFFPYLSWVKTLGQVRDLCSKYVIALPHSAKETTCRDVAT